MSKRVEFIDNIRDIANNKFKFNTGWTINAEINVIALDDCNFIVKVSNSNKILLFDNKDEEMSAMAFHYKRKMMLEQGGKEYNFTMAL